jgi:glycosyltransferase involved in cell wall biosynthesis
MEHFVSIIVPTHNRALQLKETVDSILNQTYSNFEIIIVSDASTDDTKNVVANFKDERIRFFELPSNLRLPSRVRNFGASKAEGDLIAFCDDDDIWLPRKLRVQIDQLRHNPKLNLISSRASLFPGYERILGYIQFRNNIVNYDNLLKDNTIVTSSVLMRTSLFRELGGFDESITLHIGEDWDLWLRVLREHDNSIKTLKSCLVKYRSGNFKITNTYSNLEEIESRYKYLYTKHLPESKELLENFDVMSVYKFLPESSEDTLKSFITLQKVLSKEISLSELFTSDELDLRFKDKLTIITKLIYKVLAFRLLKIIS